ncbi:hypothetical protein ACS0TY_028128 [Phlomoides rotata]
MVPQGPPAPIGGGQPVPPSLLRANSGFLGGQGGGMPSPNAFPSTVSPRNQFNMNMIGNAPNASSLLPQSFGNGGPGSGLSGPGSSQRGLIDGGGAESDPLSSIGNGMGFNPPPSSYMSASMTSNQNSSGQNQGHQQFSNMSSQMLIDQQQPQQVDHQNIQHNQQQFSVPSNPQQQAQQQQFSVPSNQQQQFQAMRAGLGGVGPVKMEPQVTNDQTPQQQLQAMRNLGAAKLEQQQLPSMRNLGAVKLEPQHSDPSYYLHQQQQQQQQQQQLLLSRQSPAAAQILHQQRLLQMQQHQLLKSVPQQRPLMQQQFQPQNLSIRSAVKPSYEPGMCARRLTHYMYQQQHRPEDNNIEFWRKFVAEYFTPNAKKKWCVSMYGSGRQTPGVFPQDVWYCEICNRKPGRGFEATAEVLPRLFKIKYESGTLEELLYVDMPREYQNSSGQIVLDYAKAIQESVFEQLRVVREGQLRLVFSPDLKICSWEFCARRHEELIPRRLLIPQVSQLGVAAQKCQAATQNATSSASVSELQNNCNTFIASARQLAKSLEVPLVNDLGYTKRYVRCLQISEVVNSMKDLIDYSSEAGTGPMESLVQFSKRTKPSAGFQGQPQHAVGQLQQQQTAGHNANNNPVQTATMQLASGNGTPSGNNMIPVHSNSSVGTVAGLLHQNSINSRQQNPISSPNGPYGGNSSQMQSPGTPSTFQPPTPSSSNNPQPITHGTLPVAQVNSPNISMQQQPPLPGEADGNDSQSSVQKIIHNMMMSSQLGGPGMMGMGTMGGDVKNVSAMLSAAGNGGNSLVGHMTMGNRSTGGPGFGNMINGPGQMGMGTGIRATVGNNALSMNARVGMAMGQQQQDLGNQLLSGLGAINGFNDLQFD